MSGTADSKSYVVIEGEIVFQLDGEEARLDQGTAVAVTDSTVRRSAKALNSGARLLIVGAGSDPFGRPGTQITSARFRVRSR